MKITVLAGSPKGERSFTLQYVAYIKKKFPEHELKVLQVASGIRAIEENEILFRETVEEVRSSDCILWAFPVYCMLVPYGYKRFIELVRERGAKEAFEGRYAASLSTSIHFFDHTAHNYIHGISEDLGMKYVGSFSAGMMDLLEEEKREKLLFFAQEFFGAAERKASISRTYALLEARDFEYVPGELRGELVTEVVRKAGTEGKKIIVLSDAGVGEGQEMNLRRMVRRFRNRFSSGVEIINLHDIYIKGPCIGCLQCGYDNSCIYEGKDGFIEFYNEKLKTADILVFAGTIKDRYLSSRWKLFFDRSFFNTHIPSFSGKQIGFIISGPLIQTPDLREILQGYAEMQEANLAGIVTDEFGDSEQIDSLLDEFGGKLVRYSKEEYVQPQTFLSVAGVKLFRDTVWGKLRPIFMADHRYYKKHGRYDFPQHDLKGRLSNAVLCPLMKIPAFRKKVQEQMKKGGVPPEFKKVLEEK